MRIECPHCHKAYNIKDERIKEPGVHVSFPCPACKKKIDFDIADSAAQPAPPEQPASTENLTSDDLKEIILRTVVDLPPMPQVAQKARQLTSSEKATFADLARLIETDQAIAARVLKIANSAYYGIKGNVTSIQHASVILGMKVLNELLTIACASTLLNGELKGYGLNPGELWKHSLAVAGCARSIAGPLRANLADDAFSAGLIHDCGKLILDRYVLERKSAFDNFLKDENKSSLEAEKALLGFDHCEIAAEVCEKWQIPKKLTTVIQFHHNPSLLKYNELGYIVHAADAIALMCGIGTGVDGKACRMEPRAAEILKLDNARINALIAETTDYVEKTINSL